jgi:multiple sugar transport system permease protein
MYQLYGPINAILGLDINWLTDKNLAMPAMIIMSVWAGSGYYMVLFLAGLQSIPETYYEAARIDGAGFWHQLRYITLPLLKPTIVFVIVISIIIGLKVFEPMYIMTGGGPDDSTKVLTLAIYETSFKFFEIGKASAMSIVMYILIMIFTVIQLRLFRSEGERL